MLFRVSGLVLSLSCISSIITSVNGAALRKPINHKQKLAFSKANIPTIDFETLDLATENFANGKTIVNVGDLPNITKPINVPLPSAGETSLDAIIGALPAVLKDVGIPPEEINVKALELAPLFDTAFGALLDEKDAEAVTPALEKRALATDIRSSFDGSMGSLVCTVFSAVAMPAYISLSGQFASKNPNGFATTTDQNYFINLVHGNIWKEDLRVFYKAVKPQNNGDATTFNKKMYLTHPRRDVSKDVGFKQTMKLLLHETSHVKQHRDLDYSIPNYGLRYFYDYCMNGFAYHNIPFEIQAKNAMDDAGTLLEQPFGQLFFKLWKKKNLLNTIGYPSKLTYALYPEPAQNVTQVPGTTIRTLSFEQGAIQIIGNAAAPCYRTLNYSELMAFNLIECRTDYKCPPKKRTVELPPDADPNFCSEADMALRNANCVRAKKEWAGIDALRKYTCIVAANAGLPAIL